MFSWWHHTFISNWKLPFLNLQKGENGLSNSFMINLPASYVAMLRFKLATPPFAVGHVTDCAMEPSPLCYVNTFYNTIPLVYFKAMIQGQVVQNFKTLLANVTFKFLFWNMANTLIFFVEKNVSSFCIAKATHIFAAKISMYLKIPYQKQLTSLSLTSSLS